MLFLNQKFEKVANLHSGGLQTVRLVSDIEHSSWMVMSYWVFEQTGKSVKFFENFTVLERMGKLQPAMSAVWASTTTWLLSEAFPNQEMRSFLVPLTLQSQILIWNERISRVRDQWQQKNHSVHIDYILTAIIFKSFLW